MRDCQSAAAVDAYGQSHAIPSHPPLVADANNDSVADHRLHDGAELTRSCQSADFSVDAYGQSHAIPSQWREDWSSPSVVNHPIVTDPTIRQPGFDLPHHTWSLMSGGLSDEPCRTGQGPCRANLHKSGLAQSPSYTCNCGHRQTMNHIVDTAH